MSSRPETDLGPTRSSARPGGRSRARLGLGAVAGGWAGLLLALLCGCGPKGPRLAMVVMDPMAKELACPCVGGYAQRNYRALAAFLGTETGTRIDPVFADELGKGLRLAGNRPVVLIVGKDSVVRQDARDRSLDLTPWFRLTDREGRTTQTGLFVVRKEDPARTLADTKGRAFFLGPADSAEKHQAALAAMKAAGVPLPEKPETCPGCSDAAARVVESTNTPPPVGVISSYAFPLLEGCGTIPAGALRILAETEPVPFVTCFATPSLPATLATPLRAALEKMRGQPDLLKKLETRDGWVPGDLAAPSTNGPAAANAPAKTAAIGTGDWPDWRGPHRDGRTLWLPDQLPSTTNWVWRQPLTGPGLAGLAVAEGLVFVADRDPFAPRDVYLAFRASDGELVWQFGYPTAGDLDYGPSPRATPLVREGRVFLLGAFGQLHCLTSGDGKVVWRKDLIREFGAALPKWGFTSTPLLVGDRLIINPGAPGASLVALDPRDGRVLWKSPGQPPGHASFILAELGGRAQIVGYDQASLGGWDPASGRRLWRHAAPQPGDFNVPTPLVLGRRLLIATENNGARLHDFGPDGALIASPVARSDRLRSETVTPVRAGGLLVGWDGGLHCLDPGQELKEIWSLVDPGLGDHAGLIATDARVLAATQGGELLLVDVTARPPSLVSRQRVTTEGGGGYVHPAISGHRLYLRDEGSLRCLSLDSPRATALQLFQNRNGVSASAALPFRPSARRLGA